MLWVCDRDCPEKMACRRKPGLKGCTAARRKAGLLPLLQYTLDRENAKMFVACAGGHETLLAEMKPQPGFPVNHREMEEWYVRHAAEGSPRWCPVCQPIGQGGRTGG